MAKSRHVHGHIMNGGARESDMNELWDKLCCLCRLSILKDPRKDHLERAAPSGNQFRGA